MGVDILEGLEQNTLSQRPGKGPCLSRNDRRWVALREEIHRIYIVEKNILPNTILVIEEKHAFKAS
jgi:hypothetical protein